MIVLKEEYPNHLILNLKIIKMINLACKKNDNEFMNKLILYIDILYNLNFIIFYCITIYSK